ncbi:MAG: hypothetical protein GXY52_06305 [Chloroflexi bacterium]|nr:hypothetical protein [Chloroflexota bacterium]
MHKQPSAVVANWSRQRALCWPVGLRDVQAGGFLGERIVRNCQHSLPLGFASPVAEPFARLNHNEPLLPQHLRFIQDSDLYKLLESASYALSASHDGELAAAIECNLQEILQREQPGGGFVLPPRSVFDTNAYHELYAAGHFIEMACAHHAATGKTHALQAACRWADMLIRERDAGNPYFTEVGTRDHPEIELALVRLYRATGEKRYLDFSAWVAQQARLVAPIGDIHAGAGKTHAVRVGYLMCGYAELYLETGDARFLEPLKPIWDDICASRLYLTGGVGMNEAIPPQAYNLPQHGAVAETCASIALMMFALRAQSLWDDPATFDTVETILYNHFFGALNAEQDAVFYYNPIRQTGEGYSQNAGKSPYERVRLPDLHTCSCCFPNVWRFLADLPEYLLATDGNTITLNLYSDLRACVQLADGDVELEVVTGYPYDGRISCHVSAPATLRLRVPGWCTQASVTIDDSQPCAVQRGWLEVAARPDEAVVLELAMPIRQVATDEAVAANLGQVAFMRGPLVYCYQAPAQDAEYPVERVYARADTLPKLVPSDGVPCLEAELWQVQHSDSLYYDKSSAGYRPFQALLVPFMLHGHGIGSSHWTVFFPLACS